MNYSKVLLSIVIVSSTLFSSCSSKTRVDRLSSDVQTLNSKIEQLNNDVNTALSDIQIAKEDAVRANQRLDNQAMKYRK